MESTRSTWVTLLALGGALLGCHDSPGPFVHPQLSSNCVSCHQHTYDSTATPVHTSVGFPTECADCHGISTWLGASFDHATTWPDYTGAHPTFPCSACHANGVYKGLTTTCYSCHLANWNNTTTPVHSTSGYGTYCGICHTTSTWAGATFNHLTSWPDFTGAHPGLACTACHADGVTVGKSTLCISCHATHYSGTIDPPHAAAGFATTCRDCHSTANFTSSSWVHPMNLFQFTGAHVGLDCLACHAGNIYKGKGTTCATCHQVTYDTTSTPVHTSAGYSTVCEGCHTSTLTWLGATAPAVP